MKVSEITVEFLREDFVHCDDNSSNNNMIAMALAGAKRYCMSMCNLSEAELDDYDDMTLAVCALVADLYDVRQYSVDGSVTVNPTTANILGRYDRNLL
ncbi:MAG: phage gp6-like head-tail connector protein [Acidaminococcaceae bacterium]|nr:phage gp6-like head-tail connector protein [Acidaminococcaceae bacterium]MBQ9634680.1 phage gp6-like head-tail connector protein [Acidaminococcaceae bacterium]